MNLFEFVVAVGGDRGLTARVRISADSAYVAQQLCRSQYGDFITYTQIYD
jgi:hypothetical protein